MSENYKTWFEYSENQQREVRTACVLVELGTLINANLSSLVSTAKKIFGDEIKKITSKKDLNSSEEKCLEYLKELLKVEASLSGLKKLEEISEKVLKDVDLETVKCLKPVAKKCFDAAPQFLKFPGFGELIKQKAVSKFVEFASNWKYTGKGYEVPKGMDEPFQGYDKIINSLMGHPLCKARMEKEAKAWEKACKKNN